MSKPTVQFQYCPVCGGLLRQDNTAGICSRTPECIRVRATKTRRARGIEPKKTGRNVCEIPGCPEFVHAHGLCEVHDWRKRHHGDPGPAGRLNRKITVKAGDTFGKWTALADYGPGGHPVPCRCECGTERAVGAHQLVAGRTLSCGGPGHKQSRPAVPYIAAGEVFARLTALEDAWWAADSIQFRCECGTVSARTAVSVRGGGVSSCSCLRRERNLSHGLSRHPLYHVWSGMIDRTTKPEAGNYASYGGRGIKVCERWLGASGLRNFIADVGERPPGTTLDRIDNDGDYEPGNVQWATPKQQARNRRSIAALTAERDALAAMVASLQGDTGKLF